MLSSLANFFKRSQPQQAPITGVKKVERNFVDIYGRQIEDGQEFFYPKKIRGVPVFTVDSIYAHYSPIIKKIIDKSSIGDHRRTPDGNRVIDELYKEVIKRFIEYAHMLPASENYHHSTTGGLISHSLQAALFSLQYGRDRKPESTKFQDIDKQVEPIYRYGAFLGGLLHDAGKITRDMVVDAVEIYDGNENRRLADNDSIPTWRPQKESLISWAKRLGVATYSVTFKPNRIHNQHNIDSAMFLPKVIGKSYAFDYLVENPVNIFDRLSEALSGHDTSVDYLSTCIRKADTLSVNKDVKTFNDVQMGERRLSKEAKILRTMQITKSEWTYNTPYGHVWVLGDSVYLRHTKAFDTIMKKAQALQFGLPNDSRIIISIMEETGMLESYDNENKLVNFAPGNFNHEDIENIFTGKNTPRIEQLFKMRWKGTLFGNDPMPDSAAGLLLSPDGLVIEQICSDGKIIRHEKEENIHKREQNTGDDQQPPIDVSAPLPDDTSLSCQASTQESTEVPGASTSEEKVDAKPVTSSDNEQNTNTETVVNTPPLEQEIKPKSQSSTKTKMDTKGIQFKNAPAVAPFPKQTESMTDSEDNTPPDRSAGTSVAVAEGTSPTDGCDTGREEVHALYTELVQVKVDSDEGNVGIWYALNHITKYAAVETNKEAIAWLRQEGLLQVNKKNLPQIVTVKNQEQAFNAICLLEPGIEVRKAFPKESAKTPTPNKKKKGTAKASTSEENKKTKATKGTPKRTKKSDTDKSPAKPPADKGTVKKSSKEEQAPASPEKSTRKEKDNVSAAMPPTEEGMHDFGLIAALMNTKSGSLASTINWSLSHKLTGWYQEESQGLYVLVTGLAQVLSKQYGKQIQARKLLPMIESIEDVIEREEDGGIGYLIPYSALNMINVKVES